MHTASSAKRTCKEFRSASEYTATVPIPSSLQAQITRRAISPRLATRIFLNIGGRFLLAAGRVPKRRLPFFPGLPFVPKSPHPFPADVRFILVHQLHCFHKEKLLAGAHVPPPFHKRSPPRTRRA